MALSYFGYNRRLNSAEMFSLVQVSDSHSEPDGFVCIISEVDAGRRDRLMKDEGVSCSVGQFVLLTDTPLVFDSLDDAADYSLAHFGCQHLYAVPDMFEGCSRCSCGCGSDSIH